MESKSRSIACPFEFFETGERIVFEKLARLRAVTRASFSRVSRDASSERESGRKTWSGKINRRQSSRDNETKLSSESISPRSLELSSKCTKRFLLPTFDSFLSNRSGKINNEYFSSPFLQISTVFEYFPSFPPRLFPTIGED